MGHKIERSGDMGVILTHTYPSIWVYHEISRRHTPVISSYQLPPGDHMYLKHCAAVYVQVHFMQYFYEKFTPSIPWYRYI